MLIARVIGTTVSTIKDEKLSGRKLLILRQTDERGNPVGKPYVAVDTVDAGIGDLVLTCAGSSARQTAITKDTPVDAVIMSLGTSPNPLIKSTTNGLEVNKKGGIIVNEEGLTSRQAVYAGGDAVTGAATVILAMGAGKLGAKSIDEYLSNK